MINIEKKNGYYKVVLIKVLKMKKEVKNRVKRVRKFKRKACNGKCSECLNVLC
jgi:hypothetical protein